MFQMLVYPWVKTAVVAIVMFVVLLMLLRLLFNYADPNPFGAVGRFVFKLKRATDRIVYPSASMLARLNMNTKIAPLITVLGTCVIGYFFLELIRNLFFTFDGVTASLLEGSVVRIVGHLLYGLLAVYSVLIVIRIVFSWVMTAGNPLLRFLMRVTNPVLEPFRRIIPPLGMFDLSPLIVLLLINFLQTAVWSVLLIK